MRRISIPRNHRVTDHTRPELLLAHSEVGRPHAKLGHVGKFTQFVAPKLSRHTTGAFAEDAYRADRRAVDNSGFWGCNRIRRLIGVNAADREGPPPD